MKNSLNRGLLMSKEEIGAKLRAQRIAQGISIRKIAEMAGTSTRAVQAVEKGWYNPGIDTYLSLARVLGVKIDVR